ncbi:MAG: T9SS C-terminal target domain-containing protein, partial [Verrucomicrobiae bacterium]|nr:T9SS C-terminal target domain-containing protein [Verrucomicrobiae bacterium]
MKQLLNTLAIMIFLLPTITSWGATIQVTDASIQGNTTWTADNEYVLNGLVFVENGETLTIEPGTVIKG